MSRGALLDPDCNWAERDYLSDAEGGAILALRGSAAAVDHLARWHARYRPERATYAAELAEVQATLAKDEFASAWSEGHAFSRERAIAYALVEVDDPTTVHVVESSERESRDAKAEPAAIGS